MPAGKKENKRNKGYIHVRLNKEELDLLEARANAHGMNKSTYVRFKALYEKEV